MNHSQPVNIHFSIKPIFYKPRLGDYGILSMNLANIYRSIPDLSKLFIDHSTRTSQEPKFAAGWDLPSTSMIYVAKEQTEIILRDKYIGTTIKCYVHICFCVECVQDTTVTLQKPVLCAFWMQQTGMFTLYQLDITIYYDM